MPLYTYTAKTLSGATIRGTLQAKDESQLMTTLREKKLFLLRSREVKSKEISVKLKPMELSDFSRQLGNMVGAGISLVRAVSIMINRDNTKRLQKVYTRLYRSLQNGMSLSEAMKEQGNTFPELFISMIFAGESSGQLDRTTIRMAEYYEKEHRLNNKVSSAMTYPVILLVVTVLVVLLIFTLVLPNFFTMYKDVKLPVITQVMIAISKFLVNDWYIALAGGILLVSISGILFQKPSVRLAFDTCKFHLPKIGKLMKVIYTARFSRTISSLYASGLPIVTTLQIGRKTLDNRYLKHQFDVVIRSVREGEPLSQAIAKVDGFDSKLSSTIMVGEETGRLESMLISVADSFDYDAEMATQRLITILEPVMIIMMALIVGSVMLAVMMPIFQMYQTGF